jgi:hypothetical protein
MSDKIDWRELTRNFLLGEVDEAHEPSEQNNARLLSEAADRRVLIKHEAARLKNTFNSAELEVLINEIKHR